MRKLLYLSLLISIPSAIYSQQRHYSGTVLDEDNALLSGVSVRVERTKHETKSNDAGRFSLYATVGDTLYFSFLGFHTQSVVLTSERMLTVTLTADYRELEAVEISTGYYILPQERLTGSFSVVDNEAFNRKLSPNILDRLEGQVPGLQFDRRSASGEDAGTLGLRVRGVGTIESSEYPLIVVDGFPYEGSLDMINPQDVENVVVLKDAAASSIWGARAANGVVVITTKTGRYDQGTRIQLSTNYTIGDRPDLHYNRQRLPSATVMEIEEQLFERGLYAEEEFAVLPNYVEALIALRDGEMTQDVFDNYKKRLMQADIRDEAGKLLYQNSMLRQSSLMLLGGKKQHTFSLSVGNDDNRSFIRENGWNRTNITFKDGLRLWDRLEWQNSLSFARQDTRSDGIALHNLKDPSTRELSPYLMLREADGSSAAIPYNIRKTYLAGAEDAGLLD